MSDIQKYMRNGEKITQKYRYLNDNEMGALMTGGEIIKECIFSLRLRDMLTKSMSQYTRNISKLFWIDQNRKNHQTNERKNAHTHTHRNMT